MNVHLGKGRDEADVLELGLEGKVLRRQQAINGLVHSLEVEPRTIWPADVRIIDNGGNGTRLVARIGIAAWQHGDQREEAASL